MYGIGQRNLEGGMLLEYCLEKEICVSNKCFKGEDKEEGDIQKW